MKYRFIIFFFALSFQFITYAETYRPLTICSILALTGDSSAYGGSIRNGMLVGYSELEPDIKSAIHLVFEDDSAQPSKTVSAFQKLTATESCSVVVTMSAQPSLAISPIVDKAGIPMMAVAIPPRIVEGHKSVFLFFATAEKLAGALVDEVIRRRYERIARISTIHEGRQLLKTSMDRLKAERIQIVLDEDYVPGEKDFRTFLTRVRNTEQIDGIYANLFLGQLGLFVKQARELGITLPIFTTEFYNDINEQKIAGTGLDNQWFIDQAQPNLKFLTTYKEKFGIEPSLGAANGSDIVRVMAEAVKQNVQDPAPLTNFLRTLKNFRGALGIYSATEDNRFDIPVAVKRLSFNFETKEYKVEPIEN